MIVTPAKASPIDNPVNPTITFSEDGIITIEVTGNGEGTVNYTITPITTGSVTVTATLDELTDTFSVQVNEAIQAESFEFPEDMPATMNHPSELGWFELVPTPAGGYAEAEDLQIESSEPTMISVQQDPGNPAMFQLTCSPLATPGTNVTITATYQSAEQDSVTIEIV